MTKQKKDISKELSESFRPLTQEQIRESELRKEELRKLIEQKRKETDELLKELGLE